MFYVTGAKIYLVQYDKEHKVFPEVKLRRDAGDNVYTEVLNTGIAKKPANREVCTLREVLAKFGADAAAKTK